MSEPVRRGGGAGLQAAAVIVSICAVAGVVYLFSPGLRARLAIEQKKAEVRAVSDDLDKGQETSVTEHGKILATLLQVYSRDNDHAFPSADADLKQVLGEYLTHDAYTADELLKPWRNPITGAEGGPFVYTGAGKKSNDPKAGQTVIGYKEGTRGKVLVYADGTAEWQPNP